MGTNVAPWKQLLFGAIEANSHLSHSSYFQLATIGFSGRPSNRTVVFRGFEENSDRIQINTDLRSRKIEELKHCPFSEICWYFSDTWEQFRINGRIEVIDASNPDQSKLQQREKAWFANSLRSRLIYTCPTPGSPCNNEQSNQQVNLDPSSGPVPEYCLLLLEPEKVDYLNLKSNQRLLFSSMASGAGEKSWTSEKVNP
ncbi:Pyridoxamine 5'-phosphate oxidase probable FMN-dependent Alr4036 family [Arabidopsis suecica]|uniref:Pyridoxamine 5'-phosphate oxidase probable FMN-dependent Alr4036 family n=1 Tax=Arabidopsis suecica TaxID=45249 RepID=A0A8T2AR92_ARASU|nr:Pyridoxamine 5'-phosphate oxidase probable FMN-dependent Alr4036 family [Arabidopsis suecica]